MLDCNNILNPNPNCNPNHNLRKAATKRYISEQAVIAFEQSENAY